MKRAIVLLGLLSLVVGYTCPAVECVDAPSTWSNDQCGQYDSASETWSVDWGVCDNEDYCDPYLRGSKAYCENQDLYEYSDYSFPEGMECDDDWDCYNTCGSDGYCTAFAAEGEYCWSDYHCEVGQYCDYWEGECTVQKEQGEDCDYDSDCENDLFCDWYYDTCEEYATGQYGDYCSDDRQCESYVCYSSECADIEDYSDWPRECDDTQDCDRIIDSDYWGDTETYDYCACAYDGVSYCMPYQGFELVDDLYDAYLSALGNDNGICHTTLRMDLACWEQELPDSVGLLYNIILKQLDMEIYFDLGPSYPDCFDENEWLGQYASDGISYYDAQDSAVGAWALAATMTALALL